MIPRAIQEQLPRWKTQIACYFRRNVSSPEDQEDLTQEVLYRILKSYPSFRGEARLSSWIYGICRNVLFNYYRGRKRDALPLMEEPLDGSSPRVAEWITMEQAVEQLTAYQKKLYCLRYREGYQVLEIAELLRKPVGTVKYQLHIIRKQLRAWIGN